MHFLRLKKFFLPSEEHKNYFENEKIRSMLVSCVHFLRVAGLSGGVGGFILS